MLREYVFHLTWSINSYLFQGAGLTVNAIQQKRIRPSGKFQCNHLQQLLSSDTLEGVFLYFFIFFFVFV